MRIDAVVAAVQRTWAGQPDLSLPALWGVVANEGISWSSSDEELVAALERIAARHPVNLRGGLAEGQFAVIALEAPARLVSLAPPWVLVRRRDGSTVLSPTAWQCAGIISSSVGGPLVLRDSGGINHRLGVIQRIGVHEAAQARVSAALIERAGGMREELVLLRPQRVEHYRAERREIICDSYSVGAADFKPAAVLPREELAFRCADGHRVHLGVVKAVFAADV